MKVLLTGATGYIGKRILPELIKNGHDVVCCVRDIDRFNPPESLRKNIKIIEVDLLKKESLINIPTDIDIAYYLVHSMSSTKDYGKMELESAHNFRNYLSDTNCKQLIYLSGIVNTDNLSEHLTSRLGVENELSKGSYHLTTLRAGIIIGSGSASFEIIRDLVEKLPIMVTPKWLNTKCQPIAVADALTYLVKSLGNEKTYDKSFDIGGPDILTYKEMLLQYARVRKLKRKIFIVPVMTPKLSSYWLYFVTSTSYKLASALVDSMKVEVVCRNSDINDIIKNKDLTYTQALERAFSKIESHRIASSWKDSFSSSELDLNVSDFINVPTYGCFTDHKVSNFKNDKELINNLWSIGGEKGYFYASWLWQIRGIIDKFFGGVGLRRGRTNQDKITTGDSIDFWRVLYANKDEGRLLLFAEMKLPGDAWLEFKIKNDEFYQTATFRPKGLSGRLYWYSVLPFHAFIFKGMIKALAN